ncbi:hypothetical protein IFT66_14695 [Rhizobium sp. CFBP 13726]|uniref:hypothetical protein n=1 Tax=Rhizobium sp. CFBP 13726 TaxID=2775296 RepID=UPI001782ACF6|nr:hypothetical protein [Rhizobium sp. CFBP 13726]MBD8652334.1 hypothetical protein [Rhizobium sp. CFBP 13726]
MRKPQSTEEWLALRAGLVALFVLLGCVGFAWVSPRISADMLCAKDEACIREWASVLGGYFAFAAAYLTIQRMKRDSEDALKFQKQNVKISMRRDFALAHVVEQQLFSAEEYLISLEDINRDMADKAFEWNHVGCSRVVDSARQLQQSYGTEIMELFEVMPPVKPSVSMQVKRLEKLINNFDAARELDIAIKTRRSDDIYALKDLFYKCELNLKYTSGFSRKCWISYSNATSEFLKEWDQPSKLRTTSET